ncbi:MAG: spermidine/putrescine ABC transporter substrate-binding protein [Anaerolineae bacterium]
MLKSKVLLILTILALLLAACGGSGSGGAAAPTTGSGGSGSSDAPAPAEAKTSSSGFACPEPSPKMEVTSTEVNIFVWTEYIPQDLIECFQEVYGITVNRDEYSTNEEMYAKVSKGGVNYDLVQPTDYIVSLMIRQNLFQKLDKSKLPNFKNLDPTYLNLSFDPNNQYTLPYQAGTDAIVVNTDKIKNSPQAWADLWKPEYDGLVMLDDSRAVIGFTLLSLGYDINTKDPKQLEEAKQKLSELVPKVKLFDSDSPKTALIAGDVNLGMTWTGEAFLAQKEKPAIQYIYPTEGALVWQDNYAILAGAPHLDAAYAWLNYSMQGDTFWLMLRDFPYTNPNKATLDYAKANQADIFNAYFNSTITNTPAEEIKKGHRVDDVGDTTPLYDKIWTEVKGGS